MTASLWIVNATVDMGDMYRPLESIAPGCSRASAITIIIWTRDAAKQTLGNNHADDLISSSILLEHICVFKSMQLMEGINLEKHKILPSHVILN